MNPVRLVAEREIRERVRSRAFRVSTLIVVVAIALLIAVPAARRDKTPTYRVAFLGKTSDELRQGVGLAGASLRAKVRTVVVGDEATARSRLRSGRLDVVVVEHRSLLVKRVPEPTDPAKRARFVRAVGEVVRLQGGFERAGVAPDVAGRVLTSPPPPIKGVGRPVANREERGPAAIGIVALFLLITQYSYWMMGGIIEEKASRVVEVLLATISPRQLLVGKVLGIASVALGQAGLTVAAAFITASATGSNVLRGDSGTAIMWMVAWFMAGFALYCLAFATMGSLVTRSEEMQNVSFPLQIPMLVGYVTALGALTSGNASPLVHVLAFVPPTAPFVMPALVGIGGASTVLSLVSLGITIVATIALARLAGNVYARAVLRTGRRVRLREVLRAPA